MNFNRVYHLTLFTHLCSSLSGTRKGPWSLLGAYFVLHLRRFRFIRTRHWFDWGTEVVPILPREKIHFNRRIMSNSVLSVISRFLEEYSSTTPTKLKVVDAYLLYILLTGALQFLYCLLVGTFPFNSFLSGFISCVGSFILAGKIYAVKCLGSYKFYKLLHSFNLVSWPLNSACRKKLAILAN